MRCLFRVTLAIWSGSCGLLCGCVTPWNTQLPTPYTAPPPVESRRNERYDPFARSDLGPDTLSRPREYTDPRSHPRQVQDAAIINSPLAPAMPNPQMGPVPGQPMQQYPGMVPF